MLAMLARWTMDLAYRGGGPKIPPRPALPWAELVRRSSPAASTRRIKNARGVGSVRAAGFGMVIQLDPRSCTLARPACRTRQDSSGCHG